MACILIVDDEDTVRQLLRRALLLNRHEVIEACNGKDALSQYIFEKDRIDVVITDMMMPESDGFSLVEEIARKNPEAKVVIMSGWFNEEELTNTQLEASRCIKGILQKPCTMEEIHNVVQTVLNSD